MVCAVKRLAAENRLPHLLLFGPPGTGKTSTILALARQLYGPALPSMTLELNASDDRGISVVRQEIQDFASTRSIMRCSNHTFSVSACIFFMRALAQCCLLAKSVHQGQGEISRFPSHNTVCCAATSSS